VGPADAFDVAANSAKHFAGVEVSQRRSDLPAPVQDTPEVAAARAEHLAAVAAAEARNAAEALSNGVAPLTSAAPQILTKVHASHFAHAGFLRPQTRYYSSPAPPAPTYPPPSTAAPPYRPPTAAVPAYPAAPTVAPTYQPQYVSVAPISGGYDNSIEDDGQYRGNEEPSSGVYSYSYNDGLSSKVSDSNPKVKQSSAEKP